MVYLYGVYYRPARSGVHTGGPATDVVICSDRAQ
jgi:hypothetical protein